MEVHHHSHTERKKWTHYFWEFLMLFLAVFAGFLAENQREHFVEHQREKQYIRSMVEDLQTDTSNIKKMVSWFNEIQTCSDSLINYYKFDKFYKAKRARLFGIMLYGYPDFIYTDRTIQQLKNAGGLRLIRNQSAADSIIHYDALVRDILIEEKGLWDYFQKLHDFSDKFINSRKYDEEIKLKTPEELEKEKISFWMTNDEQEFDRLYNLVKQYNNILKGYIGMLTYLKKKGTRLIVQLKQQYHLK